MRYALIFLCLPWPLVAAPSAKSILACLGQEELKIHRSGTEGPVYQLNRAFVDMFSKAKTPLISSVAVQEICRSKDFSPSVSLLRYLLLRGDRRVPRIFFDYLSGLQGLAPAASCLPQKLPHFSYLSERYRHLGPSAILKGEDERIRELFDGLKNLDAIFKKCRQKAPPKG